jgi:hypothetical protein
LLNLEKYSDYSVKKNIFDVANIQANPPAAIAAPPSKRGKTIKNQKLKPLLFTLSLPF